MILYVLDGFPDLVADILWNIQKVNGFFDGHASLVDEHPYNADMCLQSCFLTGYLTGIFTGFLTGYLAILSHRIQTTLPEILCGQRHI